MSNLCVLGIFAHPDDEICITGTLANHSDRGDEIHLLYLTKGEGTSKLDGTTDQIKQKRMKQAKDAASLINASVHFLNISDTEIVANRKYADKIAEKIKSIKPNIVITWNKAVRTGTGHPDHRNTHTLVIDAITYARFGNETDDSSPHRERISLYTIQHYESKPSNLEFIDVTEQYDRIIEYVKIYKETFGDYDAVEHKKNLMKYFGQYVRTDYAEAFKKLTWRKPRDYLD